jgi:hypothetical protein
MNNPTNELREMNLQEIFHEAAANRWRIHDWLISMGLLHGSQFCDNCGNRMALDRRRGICHKGPCQHRQYDLHIAEFNWR